MTWSDDERVQAIVDYVRWRRECDGIVPRPGRKPEPSCELFGEFRNLLEGQLLTTPEFQEGWLELRDSDDRAHDEIVAGVLKEAVRDLDGRPRRGANRAEGHVRFAQLRSLSAVSRTGRSTERQ